MQAVMERIEELVPGAAEGPAKDCMVGMYVVWHALVVPEAQRPDAPAFIEKHGASLDEPNLITFVVGLLTGGMPEWSIDQWAALAAQARDGAAASGRLELPPVIHAVLQVVGAGELITADRGEEAQLAVRAAVEDLPGHRALISWEAAIREGAEPTLDIWTDLLEMKHGEESDEPA